MLIVVCKNTQFQFVLIFKNTVNTRIVRTYDFEVQVDQDLTLTYRELSEKQPENVRKIYFTNIVHYYSFKIYLRFWLAQITRLILHPTVDALTKLGSLWIYSRLACRPRCFAGETETSLQCRRILGGRKLLGYVRTVVTAIFVMTEED